MSVDVVMPQMGESITEGTITKWLKNVGDTVERDEPLFEISTDKVDAEIPAPNAGVLLAINNQEGETVEVGKVVAVLGESGEQPAATPSQPELPKVETVKPVIEEVKLPEPVTVQPLTVTPATQTATAATPAAAASSEGATEVVMPQMGESITEGTITKWLKQVGDSIERDEPLFEISTDKVDAEIPAPVAGTLLAVNNQEGETVEVGKIVALIGAAGASVAPTTSTNGATAQKQTAETPIQPVVTAPVQPAAQELQKQEIVETEGRSYDYEHPGAKEDAQKPLSKEISVEDLRKTKSSPLVRNIAKEHGVDISKVHGSGMSGRVTKTDILNFIDSGANFKPEDLLVKHPVLTPAVTATVQTPPTVSAAKSAPVIQPVVGDRVEAMSVMRK